jgi:mevalonate kinase
MHSAPAKIILFGEHAVVYGQPAIAVPFSALKATANAERTPPGTGLTIIARDINQLLHVDTADNTPDNALTFAAQVTLHHLNVAPPDVSIEIRSAIPVASGLGSGAAVAAALIRELSAVLGKPLDGEELNALVYEVEKLHHGTPSGIDNTVIVMNAPVFFVKGKQPQIFTIRTPFTLVVADSGVQGSTRETVAAVRELYDSDPDAYQPFLDEIGAIVNEARRYIEQGSLKDIGPLMNRNHQLLNVLTVSSSLLNDITGAARDAGAFGAKLSGGGRGGNVIALTESDNAHWVADAMRKAGAVQTWTTLVGG